MNEVATETKGKIVINYFHSSAQVHRNSKVRTCIVFFTCIHDVIPPRTKNLNGGIFKKCYALTVQKSSYGLDSRFVTAPKLAVPPHSHYLLSSVTLYFYSHIIINPGSYLLESPHTCWIGLWAWNNILRDNSSANIQPTDQISTADV